jgi:hypothetical protein
MLAVQASSSMRRGESLALHTSRSGKATASPVKRCGKSKRSIFWSMVGASRRRAAPRSQLFLGAVCAPRLRQRAWPLAAAPGLAWPLPMRRKIHIELRHRSCMLRRMANSTLAVAPAAVMWHLAGVRSSVSPVASVPQPNHSFKRTPNGAA